MAQRDNESIFYNGERSPIANRPSRGSGNVVKVVDDLRSAVVHELVEQLNEAREGMRSTLTVADGATGRIILASSKYGLFIEDVAIAQQMSNALSNAATDIKIAIAPAGDVYMESCPTAPLPGANGVFFAEGFGANNLAGQSEHLLSTFDATKTDALTQLFAGPIHLEAGDVLYAEVVNNEGAPLTLGFRADVALTDRIALQPKDWQRRITIPTRNFSRRSGRVD